MKKSKDIDFPPKTKLKHYSVAVGENLHKRVSNHIQLLKRLENHSNSRQLWISEALKEKLEQIEGQELHQFAKDTYIAFKLDPQLHEKIEKHVELLKKLRRSYSKKQLLVEAICEKLEREERKIKDLLHKKLISS